MRPSLIDLVQSKYGFEAYVGPSNLEENVQNMISCFPPNTVFVAVDKTELTFWFDQRQEEGEVKVNLRRNSVVENSPKGDHAMTIVQTLVQNATGVKDGSRCEDRSLDNLRDENMSKDKLSSHPLQLEEDPLEILYDVAVCPIEDLIHGDEVVPVGPLWLAPYAAFKESNLNYLCESFRIRVIPSLTSLKLILNYPEEYHSNTGVLLVGDPWVQDLPKKKRQKRLPQLPGARNEVATIGKILKTEPLIGADATEYEVLKRLSAGCNSAYCSSWPYGNRRNCIGAKHHSCIQSA